MQINILGTDYSITYKKYEDDPEFARMECNGYCDGILKQIVVCRMGTFPDYEHESDEFIQAQQNTILRHEIVHAFFNESGLSESAGTYTNPWPLNEEMVDWIALQGPKIYAAWQTVDAV